MYIESNEQIMVSRREQRKKCKRQRNKIQTQTRNIGRSLTVATIRPILFLPPFLLFIPSLYRCPIECNLWKSVPQSCLADFRPVGWAVSLHVVDNGLPFRSRLRPPHPASFRSRPQQFLIPSTLAIRWT